MEVQSMMTLNRLHSITGTLTPRAPFDFAKTLGFLYGFGPTAGEQALTTRSVTKALTLQGRAVAFQVSSAGTIEQPALAYTLYAEQPLSEAEQADAADRIGFFLSIDDDQQPFYAIGQEDSHFSPIIERWYGLHQPKFLTPFEIACWAVLGQRIPWRMAHRTKLALVERWGTSITLPDGTTHRAFPEPQQLVGVEASELATVVRNERKVEYLRAVISFFMEVDEQFLRSGPYDEVAARIRGIRGIGEWSTHFILVRGLERMERVSSIDKELLKAFTTLYHRDASELPQLLDHYGTSQGYWALYARIATLNTSAGMEGRNDGS